MHGDYRGQGQPYRDFLSGLVGRDICCTEEPKPKKQYPSVLALLLRCCVFVTTRSAVSFGADVDTETLNFNSSSPSLIIPLCSAWFRNNPVQI